MVRNVLISSSVGLRAYGCRSAKHREGVFNSFWISVIMLSVKSKDSRLFISWAIALACSSLQLNMALYRMRFKWFSFESQVNSSLSGRYFWLFSRFVQSWIAKMAVMSRNTPTVIGNTIQPKMMNRVTKMTRKIRVSGIEKPGFVRHSIGAIINVNKRGCKTLN